MNVRGPVDQKPDEAGWWLASDGKWYPPESAPQSQPTQSPTAAPPPSPAWSAPPPSPGGNGFSVAALVLGIIGLLFGFIPLTFFMAAVLGAFALIFGLIGRGRAKRRATKTGMATAGTVLGILSIIMAIVGFIILVTVINSTSHKLNEIAGGANPSQYQVTVTRCSLDTTLNFPTASGTLVNTSSSRKSFTVSIRFLNAAGTQISDGTDFINDVAPGLKANWTATGTSGGRPAKCEVSSLGAS